MPKDLQKIIEKYQSAERLASVAVVEQVKKLTKLTEETRKEFAGVIQAYELLKKYYESMPLEDEISKLQNKIEKQLSNIENKSEKSIDKISKDVKKLFDEISRVEKLKPKELTQTIIERIQEIPLELSREKKDEIIAETQTEENISIIVEGINNLAITPEQQIDAKHIKNLPDIDGRIRSIGVSNKYLAQLLDVDLSGLTYVNGKYILGSGSGTGGGNYIVNQTPDGGTYSLLSGDINGINTTFTVSTSEYVSGTGIAMLNGQTLTQGDDWSETTPGSGTFDLVVPPTPGDVLTFVFQSQASDGVYLESVVAGTNITIDNTDPLNPVISSTGGGGGGTWGSITGTLSSQTDLQTALDAKAPLISPTFATSITGSYLTASEMLITNGSKQIVSAPVATYPSLTELTYVKGVTSAIQTQLDGKQATITPAALTKTDDTNVTLTLGGSPSTALLAASSLTLGWTGTLSGTRGGTGVNNGSNTITLGGNLTTSGANNVTLTTTGATNITLPTTGTLVNTAVTSLGSLGTINTSLTGPLYATAGVLSVQPTRVSVSTFSTTSTSYTDITGLNKTLAINTSYTFRIMGEWTSNNNSGQATIGFTVPAGATCTMTRFMGTTSSAISSTMQNTNNQVSNVAIGTANGIRTVFATGVVVMGGTAGDLQIRLASNNASYTATVQNIALDVTPF